MYQALNHYLSYQGMKYIKPEKAGVLEQEMLTFKAAGQEARKAFTAISKVLEEMIAPFQMERVSNWASQAQLGRPHFWCYFKRPEDREDEVALAIRLYGKTDAFGISCEVSFLERKKSETTLTRQERVLDVPISASLYYQVQKDGESYPVSGSESNRQMLKEQVRAKLVRKVLVKYDVPCSKEQTLEDLTDKLADGFKKLLPYYWATKEA